MTPWRLPTAMACMALLLFALAQFADVYGSGALEIADAVWSPPPPGLHLGLGVATGVISAAILLAVLLGHVALLLLAAIEIRRRSHRGNFARWLAGFGGIGVAGACFCFAALGHEIAAGASELRWFCAALVAYVLAGLTLVALRRS